MSHHPRFVAVFLVATFLVERALAGPPDPRSLDRLEDQWLDGDIDAEDLAGFRSSPPGDLSAARRGHAYLALEAFGTDRRRGAPSGDRELGAMVILNLPLERFAAGPRPRGEPGLGPAAVALGQFDAFTPDAPSSPNAIFGLSQDSRPAPAPSAPPTTAAAPKIGKDALVVTTELARSCVRAAWRSLGLADDARLDGLASRARTSAMLPEMRLRLARTIDESGRLTVSDADPDRYTEAGAATNWLEARLTFRLDRLLFADDEIPLERLRIDRSEQRARTAAKVVQVLFEWQRAYALTLEGGNSTDEHFAAMVREVEAAAILDVMTDGWFGRFRAKAAQPGP